MQFTQLSQFEKDIKRLHKKYSSIHEDLHVIKKVILIHPVARPPFSYEISGLYGSWSVIKIKKITSDSFKGRGAQSGFRIIYAYSEEKKEIVLIEMYHKNEKEVENKERFRLLKK